MFDLFQCLLTLNKLALTLSPTSKLKILEECEEMTSQKAKEMASSCCLCNLVGDNCDFRIQPACYRPASGKRLPFLWSSVDILPLIS